MLPISTPITQYSDLDGSPLENGYLYFGVINQNPITSPTTVFWDSAGTQPAAQPIRTIGGRASRNGTPSNVYANQNFSLVIKNSKGVVVFYGKDSSEFDSAIGLNNNFSGTNGASLIGWIHNFPGSVLRTVQSRLRDVYHITDASGVVADSTTDNTAAILAAFSALGPLFMGVIFIPYGVKFNFTAVNAAMPVGAILDDHSAINAWYTAGYKQRTFGYTDAGDNTAAIDMQFRISSGHNATMILDNRGTASSNSGQLGIAGLLWGRGQFTKQVGQEGTRHLARVEWSKIPGGSKWWWILRNHASWAARDFEYWYTGKTWAAGSYCQSDPGGIYVTAAGGISGATPPTHSSGTVSDGGVSWTYFQSLDNGIWAVNENGEMATNITPADGVVAYFKGSPNSVGSASLFVEAANGKGAQNADLRLRPTNASGFAVAMPYHTASDGVGFRLISSTGTRTGYLMDDANGLQLACWAEREGVTSGGITNPSVADIGLLRLANAGATSITTFTNSSPRQIVKVWAENANTTLVHNASFFVLRGGVNVLLQPNYVVVMQRYSQSAAWFEVSRNF